MAPFVDRQRKARQGYRTPSFLGQKAASSKAGQHFHEMMSRQGRMTQPGYESTPVEIADLKSMRREWNRNLKSTPTGIMASGVDLGADPFGAQDLYHDMSAQLAYDTPAAYNEMYPLNLGRISKGIEKAVGSTMPFKFLKGVFGDREPIVPQNVLEMRKRFPGINELVPSGGLAELVPEHMRQKELLDLNETIEGGEGIFGGTGRSALEEIDVKKYIPPISDKVLAEWFVEWKPEMNLTAEMTERLIRDLEPSAKQYLIEKYKESQ